MNLLLGERIKELRKENKLTMKELGNMLNLAESTISLYETGKREPDSYTIAKIAKTFNVSVDYLLGIEENSLESMSKLADNIIKGTRIAVLGTIRAGIPNSAVEDVLDYEEITEEMARHGKHFALKIKGNSMFPNLLEGDIVIFRECEDAETGSVCAVLVNGDEATVKKIKKTEQGILLIPFNQADFEPMFYTNEDIEKKPVRIIGKAVEIRRSL